MALILRSRSRLGGFRLTLVLVALAITTRAQPAPAPAPAASAPASAPSSNCDCNPSLMATTGMCQQLRLPTPWSCDVNPYSPFPEYPRPQLVRQHWLNLNGIWQWEAAPTWDSGAVPVDRTLNRTIVVPYPVESDLSGVPPPYNIGVLRMWYRRLFHLPTAWDNLQNATTFLLHFDGVDWEAEVFVNGESVGAPHQGGYDRFSYDITSALGKVTNSSMQHELIVRVYDPTESAHIPLGKQRLHDASGIFYTSSSGIWKPVWIEPVSDKHITMLDMDADIDTNTVNVSIQGSKAATGLPVAVTASWNGTQVASANGTVGTPFNLTIPNANLWSPWSPYLYDLDIKILPTSPNVTAFGVTNYHQAQEPVDIVTSYTGLRKYSLGTKGLDTPLRIFLNKEPIFQLGMLDQGFWPDGIYTPPTDDALKWDVDLAKRLNFTTLRKHIKVESDRYYHHCDRAGILVWQDMPAMYWEDPYTGAQPQDIQYRRPAEKAQFEQELRRLIEGHRSFTSVVHLYTFNEGWGEFDSQQVVQLAKSLAPHQLWGAASGWIDPQDRTMTDRVYDHYKGYVGDIKDDHWYDVPDCSGATETRANVLGEIGGLRLYVPDHSWNSDGGSGGDPLSVSRMDNGTKLEDTFADWLGHVRGLAGGFKGLSGAIWTQLSDVEGEVNGIVSYDRKVLKFPDEAAARAAISQTTSTQLS